ncbi:hypothetical protein GCM10023321_08670 [Pseudonocardia eucalypti]|uniref:Uncharacterized protein n=2 Tax=Pseudonocardia eucalypti TaxID=648755 RepID=A0ABP9PJC8_9PSEU
MRDLAAVIGVTERTVQAIVADLEAAGYVTHTRIGRRNRYTVHENRPFRHPAQDGHLVGPLLDLLAGHKPHESLAQRPPAAEPAHTKP